MYIIITVNIIRATMQKKFLTFNKFIDYHFHFEHVQLY